MNFYKITYILLALLPINTLYSECIGDINNNDTYDVNDIIQLRDFIIDADSNSSFQYTYDLNSDLDINIFDIVMLVQKVLNQSLCIYGITETDSNGNYIGNIDGSDWCVFTFDDNETSSGYGLNPPYPNPVSLGDWGPLGESYQLCYQYSTPYDPQWNTLNSISVYIFSSENDTIYTHSDNYSNGQLGMCIYIDDSTVNNSIYRMKLISDEFECFGDIEFN